MTAQDRGNPNGKILKEVHLPWDELEARLPVEAASRNCVDCLAMLYGKCLVKDSEGGVRIPRDKVCDVSNAEFESWKARVEG